MKYKPNQGINWHKATWDGAPNPIAYSVLYCFDKEGDNFGCHRNFALFIFKNNLFYLAYDREDLCRFGKKIVDFWKNSEKYDKFKKNALLSVKRLSDFGKKIEKLKLKKLNDEELLNIYMDLFKKYTMFYSWLAVCEPVDTHLQKIIDDIIKKYDTKTKLILTNPIIPSFIQEKEKIEINICNDITDSKRLGMLFKKKNKEIIGVINQDPYLYKKFIDLKKEYFWIRNNYLKTKILDINFFINEIKDLLKKNDYNKKYLNKKIIDFKKRKKEKEKLIKKLKLTKESIYYINLLDDLTYIHDMRKKEAMKNLYYFDLILYEIGKRTKIEIEDLKYLAPKELIKIFDSPNLRDMVKKRKKGFVFHWEYKGKLMITYNKGVFNQYYKWVKENFHKEELKGDIASPDGIIRGYTKICLSPKEINKLKNNEILVVTNTNPEYINAMKRSSAILAEKGGLTSHAAIISRELKIPCIIGIDNVTEILKDNDLVEVDANKGVVKILKRK